MTKEELFKIKDQELSAEDREKLKEAKMIGAVVNIRADIFRSLIGPDRAWKDLTLKLIDEKYADVPLWYITKCWDILMSEYPDLLETECCHALACYDTPDRSFEEARNALEEIKLLWKEHYDIDIEKCDVDLSRFNVFHEDTFDRTMDVILSEINYCDTLQNISYLFDALDCSDVSDLLEITASLVYA